jgi:hypothetical protein
LNNGFVLLISLTALNHFQGVLWYSLNPEKCTQFFSAPWYTKTHQMVRQVLTVLNFNKNSKYLALVACVAQECTRKS